MISASHNPALDNGIKFFGGDGFKLDDDRELEIEALLDAAEDTLPRPSAQGLGTVMEYPEGLRKYQEFLVSTGVQLEGMHVVLDTANGAASTSARQIFADLGAQLTVIGENPDGLNINDGVGSTHPEHLQEKVKEVGAAIGLAFDGDSDRLIAVDENGEIVDGDKIMYIIGSYLSSKRLARKKYDRHNRHVQSRLPQGIRCEGNSKRNHSCWRSLCGRRDAQVWLQPLVVNNPVT